MPSQSFNESFTLPFFTPATNKIGNLKNKEQQS